MDISTTPEPAAARSTAVLDLPRDHNVDDPLQGPAVTPAALRPDRRRPVGRRTLGAIVTIVVVIAATVTVALSRDTDRPNAVFEPRIDTSFSPSFVAAFDDAFVGLSPVDDARSQWWVVTSRTGSRWSPAQDAPVIEAESVLIGQHNGVVQIVGFGGSGLAGGSPTIDVFRSNDMQNWQRRSHAVPDWMQLDVDSLTLTDVSFVRNSVVVLGVRSPMQQHVDEVIATFGADRAVCESYGFDSRTTVRVCGSSERLQFDRRAAEPFRRGYVLFGLDESGVFPVELPDPVGVNLVGFGRWRTLYQTQDGVGVADRRNFESLDGRSWTQRELAGPLGAMVAGRGDEQVYTMPFSVSRYGPEDPVKTAGYSADGGATWVDVRLDLVPDGAGAPPGFRDLSATAAGWAVVATRLSEEPPTIAGVEFDAEDPAAFSVTADGFVLRGRVPFGPAQLLDANGMIVRSWDHLETSNLAWSGIEQDGGDIVVLDEITGRRIVTLSAEQWSAAASGGRGLSTLLFSPDGVSWRPLRSSAAGLRILAMTDDAVLIERAVFGGNPIVEAVALPNPAAEAD